MSNHELCIVNSKKKDDVHCELSESFDFGSALEKVYPLLQIIFEKLPYQDLKSACLVSNEWAKYGQDELEKRNGASWTSLVKSKKSKSQLTVEKSYNFKFDSISFGLIFYNYYEIKLNNYICIHDDVITRMTFTEYLIKEIVPENTDFWVFSCSHVYSPNINKAGKCYIASTFIPQIPNIKVKKLITPSNKIDKLFEENTFSDGRIHCVLMFTLSYPSQPVKKFIKKFANIENADKIAVGGGVMSGGIKPFQKKEAERIFKANTLFCLVIEQEDKNLPADFDSYSVVIPEEIDFEEKLQEFKDNIKLREHSFALRICCAAKANKKKESELFNKIFPETFLVGLDADGEFGWDKFDTRHSENDLPEKKRQKLNRGLCHEYTTIIVFMTWGKNITC